jgi:hypothetical protein
MASKVLLAVASAFEALTGLGLIVAPTMVKFLLGTDISGATITIARVGGFGLLLLGVVCWPWIGPIVPRVRAMLIYNVLVATYLGYLRLGAESVGRLLLPAIAVHTVLAILFIGVWFKHPSTLNDVRKSSYGH